MSLLFTLTIWTLCSVSLTSICTPAVFVSSYRTTWSRRALWVCVEQPDKGLTEVWFYIIIWHVLSEASFFSYNNEILPPFFFFFCHYSLLRQDKTNVDTENQSSSNEQLTLYLFITNDWILALFHCMVRYGSARLGTVRYGSVQVGLHFHRSLVPL